MFWIDNFLRKIITYLLKGVNRYSIDEKIIDTLVQFIKFGIVGVSNSMVSYSVYTITLLLLTKYNLFLHTDYLIAQGMQFILSVLWAFYWQNRFVFRLEEGKYRSIWKCLIKTYISYSFTGLFLNSFLLILWTQVLHISKFIAPLINIIICMPINFLIDKYWAFKSKNKSISS